MTEQQIIKTISALTDRVNDIAYRLDSMTNSKVDELTPYKATKTAYIDDTEIIFTDIPQGNLSVFVVDSEGNYPNFTVDRTTDKITVSFEPCENVTTVTISIL